MGTSKRFWALCAASATAISAAASGCNDNDHTELCVGPDCPQYDGVGGERNFFRSGDPEPSAGSAGSAGQGAEPPDAGSDAAVEPPPAPDGGNITPPLCELAFVLPSAVDAGDVNVDGSSDTDGEACGSTFSLAVGLTSNANTVTLFVNNNPLTTQTVAGGAVNFDALLGNRGATANVLRAEATMADSSTCSLTFPTDIFVACAGPSCSIDSPVSNDAGYLNDDQDGDAADGFQTDIIVGTEVEHQDQSVRLEIDSNFGAVPDAVVLDDDGSGSATFGNVPLSEGDHTVRAECSDAFGVTTLSAPVAWNVDTTPCTISITSLAGGDDPITPANDESGSPGIQVLADGQVSGGDCKTLWIGACGEPPVAIPLLAPAGNFSLPLTLSGSTGSLDICGVVEDNAGNVGAQDQITVNLRLEAPQVAIVTPAPDARFNVLADAVALNSTCETSALVNCTEVGENVELLADGIVIASAACATQGGLLPFLGRASFAQVSLPTKNDGTFTALTAQQTIPGFSPAVSASVSIQADCEAPSCSFVSPDPNSNFSNTSPVTFTVQSDASSIGQSVQLLIDGSSGGPPVVLAAQGSGSAASFVPVALTDAAYEVQASCSDLAGNVQTATEQWTVDTLPCSSSIVVAGGVSVITTNDDGGGAPDLQVSVAGLTTGGDCATVRVGVCGALSGSPSVLTGPSFSLPATLPSVTGSADVCVEVTDNAGNVATVQSTVAVRVDPPVVAITPLSDSTFNLSSPGLCDATLVATCTDAGDPVELFVDGTSSDIETCQGDNTVTFTVPLATKNDGSLTSLAVQQTSDGLVSALDSINVQADCQAPVLAFSDPTCGGFLGLETDDVDDDAGLQTDITVQNDGNPSVLLTISRGGSVISSGTVIGNLISTTFSAADLGGLGQVDLSACATDLQGNQGCVSSCLLDIVTEPAISITSPQDDDTLVLADDCSGAAAGLQVTVTGTTDAATGSEVEVQIGTATAGTASVLAGGTFSACVDAPHGLSETVTATVIDDLTGFSDTTSIDIVVNALSAITAPTAAVDGRREGTMELTWNPVNDPFDTALDSYDLRCSLTIITDEDTWEDATPVTISTEPEPAGAPQSDIYGGFRTGTSRFCVLRGVDALGFVTPLPATPSVTVANPFLTNTYDVTSTSSLRIATAGIGDINGDGEDDFIVGSENNGAQVFFGGSLDADADIIIDGITTGRFGSVVAGLGDVNGDGRPDFAVGAPALTNGVTTNAGSVFVLFGKADGDTWPGTVTLAANPGCGADVCLHGTQGSAFFGVPVAGAKFSHTLVDDNGVIREVSDIVIGVQNQNTRIGRVYVVIGGTQLTSGSIFTLPGSTPDGFQIDPTTIDSFFGTSLAPVGLGGDDFGDLVIGAVGRTTGSVPGAAYFIPGRAHTGTGLNLISATVGTQFATGTASQFATTMGGLGDFNGDTFGDVCVAHDFQTASGGGSCSIYLGRDPLLGGGFTSSKLEFTNDVGDNDWSFFTAQGFQGGLGLLGDLDGDGLGEVLLGSQTVGTFNKGTAELFYGANGATDRARSAADLHFFTVDAGHIAPSFVGDIDGDDFNDLAVFDTVDTNALTLTPAKVTLLY